MKQAVRITCTGAKTVPIERLTHFQGNLKSLSQKNYEKLKAEILELGFSEPISVWEQGDKMFILNGHQRTRTLTKMKGEGFVIPEVPVSLIQAETLKEAKKKVLALTSQYGVMEQDGLYEFMSEAGITPYELDAFRFPEIDVGNFVDNYFKDNAPKPIDESNQDDVPDVPRGEATVKTGDLFRCGEHLLLCGDSTKWEQVRRLGLGEGTVDLLWTDPPYNVDYKGGTGLKIMNDKMGDDAFLTFLTDAFKNANKLLKPGAAFYIAHADSYGWQFRYAVMLAGELTMKQCLIWVKDRFVMGRQDYHWQHEPILFGEKDPGIPKGYVYEHDPLLYGWKEGSAHRWYADRKQTTVINVPRPQRSSEHPTMKPVELVEHGIKNSSEPGDWVLDLFGGSGTTMIACEKAKRRAALVEMDPYYCQVILTRFQTLTGISPQKAT